MASGDKITVERFRFSPKIAKLQFLIAHHARIRRSTSLVFARKIIDHQFFELIGFIDDVVRNSERVRHTASVRHRLWAAALVLRPSNTVLRPDLHRHANNVVALLAQQMTGDTGIHPAAHSEQYALLS